MRSTHDDVLKVLISEDEISKRVGEIAVQIDEYYSKSDKKLLLLGILKGSVVFMAELMKRIEIPVEIDFMKVSSYGGSTVSSKNLTILLDLNRKNLEENDVLIVEDIIDSGRTLSYLVDYINLKGAASVRTCTLLDKPSRREVDFLPDFCGFTIPDEFVIGYGLDFDEKYRALPYVGILKPELYEKR
ncbi:MAG: hypoxanthine phosphoribosyltransferase [Firmicutes bacterium]|nr:hypoxanthine phosphoribosyltransferase [Bacillota bacterium]